VSAVRFAADGVLVVDKPTGPTSHDVVQVARRSFGARVGHTGTLDPLASGVLPLVLGRATRLARFLSAGEKTYEATVVFGRETDTYDAAGRTTAETGDAPAAEALAALVAALPGRRPQTPPAYSAKKIGGEPAHRLARRDAAIVPAPVDVEIHEAALLGVDRAEARLRLRVSAGFYVRSLAHDLGRQLGTGAHLGALRRVRSGPFGLDDAVSWALVATQSPDLPAAVIPLERLLTDLPAAHLDAETTGRVRHGRQVVAAVTGWPGGSATVRLFDPDGRLVGVADAAGLAPGPSGGPKSALLQPAIILG
jgi:tRNA pseudouridine55 synthase